jgi:hypothetical protein
MHRGRWDSHHRGSAANGKSSKHKAKKRDFEFADFRGLHQNSGGTSNISGAR